MIKHLKIPAELHSTLIEDLRRSHSFAMERVGFLFARPDQHGNAAALLIAFDYLAVPDNGYEPNSRAGATINSIAIRAAMEKALALKAAAFHVHEHPWKGRPGFSTIDENGWAKLMPCFQSVVPAAPHGAVVFSLDAAEGKMWIPGRKQPVLIPAISIVGFPTRKTYGS